MTEAEQIELAGRLFVEGWSGGTPEAALPFLTDDIVMRDILGHPDAMLGHSAIVDFVKPVAAVLKVLPEEYFSNEQGLALTWMAYIEIRDESHGPENKGRWLCGEGMSKLEFRGEKVSLEIDYWKGPQGICEDWREHFERRQRMTPTERGAIPGS